MGGHAKRKIHLPGWTRGSINERGEVIEKECGKYPFPVANSSTLLGLRQISFDLLNDSEADFIIFRRHDVYSLSRAPGHYHLEMDYSRVHGMLDDTPLKEERLYGFYREEGRVVKVKIYNGAEEDAEYLF